MPCDIVLNFAIIMTCLHYSETLRFMEVFLHVLCTKSYIRACAGSNGENVHSR